MMIDSSVLIAILENEPEADRLIEAITHDSVRLISAVSMCLDPIDHKLYKFGKLYRARQVLCSLMTGKETIDEHS